MKTISPEMLLAASLGIALVPLMIAIGTCYLKFSIVFSLLKSGFGTQQAPSAALVMALSLVMSLVVMQPVMTATAARVSNIKIGGIAALSISEMVDEAARIVEPWKAFLLEHAGDRELVVFSALANRQDLSEVPVVDKGQVQIVTAIAAFVLSEIKKGFTLAFYLLLPFFVIDLIVANLLVAMGLTMMSPVIVSLPLKLILFISSDGWLLLARNLVQAYY